ncbi:MAG: phosphoribosylformylglycinamidine cyclo-ligase, partial [Candidatus Aminicenantales bacterium]
KAGVDIDKAEAFLKKIKPLLAKTKRKEVIGKVGGFSGLFKPRLKQLKNPVLVSATDGVGTKLMVAGLLNRFETVGVDLVAMCVNDIVVCGAEPLFFLDYIACGRLKTDTLYAVMKGIARGCRQAGCALIGGETAELPGMYAQDKFDLAGFCLGLISQEKIIDGRSCHQGDLIIGLASSGLHSNGFSLVRRLFSSEEMKGTLGRTLLRPTRIYVSSILNLVKRVKVKAMAHITGGGFYENIPRVLPKGVVAVIDKGSWPIARIFRLIQDRGEVDEGEMFRTFNMGIGLVVIVGSRDAPQSLALLEKSGEKAWLIGRLEKGQKKVIIED